MINPYTTNLTPEQAARKLTGKQLAEYHFGNPQGVFLAEWQPLSDRLIKFGRGYLAFGDTGYLYEQLSELASYKRQRVRKSELLIVVDLIRRTIERGEAFLAAEQVTA